MKWSILDEIFFSKWLQHSHLESSRFIFPGPCFALISWPGSYCLFQTIALQQLTGVIILPTQTMHLLKGNPSTFAVVACLIFPKWIPFNDPCITKLGLYRLIWRNWIYLPASTRHHQDDGQHLQGGPPTSSYKWSEITPMSRVKFHSSYPWFFFSHL